MDLLLIYRFARAFTLAERTEKPKVQVNMKKLQETVFRELAKKPNRLSGSEIRFIRKHMRMTQSEFASWLNNLNLEFICLKMKDIMS